MAEDNLCHVTDFNSHTREGVTQMRHLCTSPLINFNSHTREGVTDRGLSSMLLIKILFQLTHREGVTIVNQYPLPEDENISTHTPVRV